MLISIICDAIEMFNSRFRGMAPDHQQAVVVD